MNCREFVEFLMDHLDGTLPEEQAATFDAHMDDCPSCVTYLETYRETIRLGKCVCGCPDDAIPADVPEKLVAAILAARRVGGGPG
jgi:anti-sigma factor RsiW